MQKSVTVQNLFKLPVFKTGGTRAAFTLIEMLVVVSVIGLLVAIASYHNVYVLKKAKDAALMNELSLLRTAVHQFALQNNGRFPESLDQLSAVVLRQVPRSWQGSGGQGSYCYNPVDGVVTLYKADDQSLKTLDAVGKNYADY